MTNIKEIRRRAEESQSYTTAHGFTSTTIEKDRATLLALLDEAISGMVEIEGSGPCYCPRDVDGQRLSNKCFVCVARAFLAKVEE